MVGVAAEPAVAGPGFAVAEGPVEDRALGMDGRRRCRDGGGGGRVLDGLGHHLVFSCSLNLPRVDGL